MTQDSAIGRKGRTLHIFIAFVVVCIFGSIVTASFLRDDESPTRTGTLSDALRDFQDALTREPLKPFSMSGEKNGARSGSWIILVNTRIIQQHEDPEPLEMLKVEIQRMHSYEQNYPLHLTIVDGKLKLYRYNCDDDGKQVSLTAEQAAELDQAIKQVTALATKSHDL